jgi:hypothetical protein
VSVAHRSPLARRASSGAFAGKGLGNRPVRRCPGTDGTNRFTMRHRAPANRMLVITSLDAADAFCLHIWRDRLPRE